MSRFRPRKPPSEGRRRSARRPRTREELTLRAREVNEPGYARDPIAGRAPHDPVHPPGTCESCARWRCAARRGLTVAEMMETVDPALAEQDRRAGTFRTLPNGSRQWASNWLEIRIAIHHEQPTPPPVFDEDSVTFPAAG